MPGPEESVEPEAGNNVEAAGPKEKKHDSGTADLEKVTDYAEEKEIAPSSSNFDDALANIRKLKNYSTSQKAKEISFPCEKYEIAQMG